MRKNKFKPAEINMANQYYPLEKGKECYCPIDGEELAHPLGLYGYHPDWFGLACHNCGAYYSTDPKEHRKQALKHLRDTQRRIKVKKEELRPLERIIETAAEYGVLK